MKLVTINGLKRVSEKLYKDTKKIKGNSMMKIDDVVSIFKEALLDEQGKF